MPVEIAVATPFDSGEIAEIAVSEFRKRLAGLGPLQGGKEYAYFELQFEVHIKLIRAGEEAYEAKETLAWANVVAGNPVDGPSVEEVAELSDTFKSKEPNVERVDRDMPLNVETTDGKGGKITKKVRIKG
jgi:hypothetical protein